MQGFFDAFFGIKQSCLKQFLLLQTFFKIMAFIQAKDVAAMRKKLKDLFPAKKGFKFSLTCENHSTVHFTFLEAPLDFLTPFNLYNESESFKQGKEYKPKSYFQVFDWTVEKPELEPVCATLKDVFHILNGKDTDSPNYDKSDTMIDYFDVGWYVRFYIGNSERPFIFVQ